MPNNSLRDRCHINTNYDTDTFVGIKCENGNFTVSFPLGFALSDDEKTLRKEIMLMLNTISATTKQMDSKVQHSNASYPEEGFPFQAYMYILSDYFSRGLYREREQHYQVSRRGKIDWNRTIKTQKPYVQGLNAFYIDFVTRKSSVKDDELITLIHEYCVFDSMRKIGWLFTSVEPTKPRIKLNTKLFRTIINDKLRSTFNDRNRVLFTNMLAIIEYLQADDAPSDYKCGTNRFEYVWEAIIDKVFGIEGKEVYFPKTTWNLGAGSYNNACLEPDTIMLINGNVYVLDAKYYKYGSTKRPWDLPESTSINKQITYGEYIAEEKKFKNIHGEGFKTYNAFLMPFSMERWGATTPIVSIGNATSDWKSNLKEYETVIGVLVDVKHLMKISVHENSDEMARLAEVIEREF